MEIQFISRKDIDELKWNSCVHYANNGHVYGYTWYLDNVCHEWDGLIEGDYESVFPLVWNKKLFGIHQLYQPIFCQQLGLFSIRILSPARIRAFLNAIPKKFKYINIQVNGQNKLPKEVNFIQSPRTNLELSLRPDYETIRTGYSKNLKRSLNKAAKKGISLTGNVKPERLVEMYKQNQAVKIKSFDEAYLHAAHRIIYQCLYKGLGFISGALNEKGDLIAAAFFITSHKKIINLLPSSTAEGRDLCAMHLILDLVIQINAGKPLTLDFEGSSIPSIARFYKSYGATEKPFYQLSQNQLPFWLKWARP